MQGGCQDSGNIPIEFDFMFPFIEWAKLEYPVSNDSLGGSDTHRLSGNAY
jgi:hypothetical protein